MTTMKKLFCLSLLLSLPVASLAQVVATVGKKKISLEEFKEKYNEVKKNASNVPEPEVFLEDLIRYEMGVMEAQRRDLEKDPLVRERFKQELYKALVEKAIGKQVSAIKVSEREMKEYYKSNPSVRLSHILIEFKPDANEKEKAIAKNRALDIYKKVKASKRPFPELVGLYTDDTLSKNTGGDIGYHSRVTVVPQIYDTALKMDLNEIKGPIETQHGFHIIKVTDRRSYQQANKRQIRAAVFDQKRVAIFNKYFANLKKKYPINKNESLVKSLK